MPPQEPERFHGAAYREDRDAQGEEHEKRDHPSDVEDELFEKRMDERVGTPGPCHPDRQRPGDTIDAETEAIVVLCIAREAR